LEHLVKSKNRDFDRADGLRDQGDTFESFFKDSRKKKSDQKTAQLCRQVFRTLSLEIGMADDDALLDVSVEAVEPAPDASRLHVLIRQSSHSQHPRIEIEAALERQRGKLRAYVAAAITRKRAPELAFVVIGPAGGRCSDE
jgi:ribosome-binding factor A